MDENITKGEMLNEMREEEDAILTMRERILKRISEIRNSFGADRFGKPGRKGKLPFMAHWPYDYDFSKLSDKELMEQFELLLNLSYRQR